MKNLQPSLAIDSVRSHRNLFIKLAPGIALFAAATSSVLAADSVRAWGSSSNTNMQMQSSASYHQIGGQSAQIVSSGGDTRAIYKSVTTCGVCTYNTNTGNNNTIDGNNVTSTNSGSVTSTTSFSDTSLITTTTPTTAANTKR